MTTFESYNSVNINENLQLFSDDVHRIDEKEIRSNDLSMFSSKEDNSVLLSIETDDNKINIINLSHNIKLSKEDEVELIKWIKDDSQHTYYLHNMFRIILKNYILIVKIYFSPKNIPQNKIIYGLALANTPDEILKILTQRQNYVLAQYM